MSLTIRHCTVDEIASAPTIGALIDEYALESHHVELPPHDAQWEQYRAIEQLGALQMIGAFMGDELIGMMVVICNRVPHYGVMLAVTESFFVTKAHRKSGAGLRLLRAAEQYARQAGAPCMMVSAPHGGVLEQVMPRVGYRHSNSVFIRRLAA